MIGCEAGKKKMRLKGTGLQETLSKHCAGRQQTIGQAEAHEQCMLRCRLHIPSSQFYCVFCLSQQDPGDSTSFFQALDLL